MQKLKLEHWDITKLVEYARNPRKNDDVVERMKASIREFGFRIPIIAKSDGTVVDGHLRLKAARALEIETVPVVLADELTDTQVKAFRLLANQSANWAEWDNDLLKLELEDLKLEDFDIDLIGFDFEIEESPVKLDGDPDEVPEPPVEPKAKRGDLWLLGNHRLLCGDSTSIDDVERLMNGAKAGLLLTDPPYGIKQDKGFSGSGGFSGKKIPRRQYNDNWDIKTPESLEPVLLNSESAIVFGGNFLTNKLPVNGFWLVWDKKNTMPTFGDCELAWTNIKRNSVKKYELEYNGLIGKEKQRFHPTQKPVGLLENILKDFSKETDIILDGFGGSGTTLIACEKLNRKCYMMELDEHYCDVIINRWQNLTGKEAVHSETGLKYNEL